MSIDAEAPLRQASGEGPLETIRARQLIESELAAQAAVHMKRAQIAGLRNALALMRSVGSSSTRSSPTA